MQCKIPLTIQILLLYCLTLFFSCDIASYYFKHRRQEIRLRQFLQCNIFFVADIKRFRFGLLRFNFYKKTKKVGQYSR